MPHALGLDPLGLEGDVLLGHREGALGLVGLLGAGDVGGLPAGEGPAGALGNLVGDGVLGALQHARGAGRDLDLLAVDAVDVGHGVPHALGLDPLGIEGCGCLICEGELAASWIALSGTVGSGVPADEVIPCPAETVGACHRNRVFNIATLCSRGLTSYPGISIQVILKACTLTRVVEINLILTTLSDIHVLRVGMVISVVCNFNSVLICTLICSHSNSELTRSDDLVVCLRINIVHRQRSQTACVKLTVQVPRADRVFLWTRRHIVVCAVLNVELLPLNLIDIFEQGGVRQVRGYPVQRFLDLLHIARVVQVNSSILTSIWIAQPPWNKNHAQCVSALIV